MITFKQNTNRENTQDVYINDLKIGIIWQLFTDSKEYSFLNKCKNQELKNEYHVKIGEKLNELNKRLFNIKTTHTINGNVCCQFKQQGDPNDLAFVIDPKTLLWCKCTVYTNDYLDSKGFSKVKRD